MRICEQNRPGHLHKPPGERGQSLMELALMMTLLLVILAGILDIGRAYFTYVALRDAAGEGAYYGSIHPTWHASGDNPNPNNIEYRVKQSAPSGGLINWSLATVSVDAPDTSPSELIKVTIAYDYTLVTPFVGALVGSQTVQIKASSVAEIISPGP